jgi:hypothetical protein
MSSSATVLVIASGVQGGHLHASTSEALLIVLLIAALGFVAIPLTIYLHRRSRRPQQVRDQWQALAVMGELCPHGWQAHITLRGWGAPVPEDAPAARAPLVELEWQQFEEGSGRVVVARRVWAPTIGDALQTMVDDRHTDLALEQIERDAAEEGDWWGD